MTKINFDTLTPCGESCVGCKKKAESVCQGCLESDGHCKEWERLNGCPIFSCTKEHGVKFCGLCSKFPCEFMLKTITWREDIVSQMRELAAKYTQK